MYGHYAMAIGLLSSASALPFAVHGSFLLPAMVAVLVTVFIAMAVANSVRRRRAAALYATVESAKSPGLPRLRNRVRIHSGDAAW